MGVSSVIVRGILVPSVSLCTSVLRGSNKLYATSFEESLSVLSLHF